MITPDGYQETRYLQFQSPAFLRARCIAGLLVLPLVWPLALLSRTSDFLFRTVAEALSLVPYLPGVILRAEFYRFALDRCGRNLVMEFGALFLYRRVAVGDHVLIGRYSIIHRCDLGSYVLVGERCTLLSGGRQHRLDRLDVPMALQGGQVKHTEIGDDCWIGSHAVVMEDVGPGSVVAAGAVVTRPVESRTIVGGNPAKLIRRRVAAPPDEPAVAPARGA